VEAELLHADGRTGEQDEVNSPFSKKHYVSRQQARSSSF